MGYGQDKVAQNLIDLQPTAIVELFLIYFNFVDDPESFIAIHGGSNFENPIIWQGVKYLPLPTESEGFEVTSNGELIRPKIRISNKNYFITDLLNKYEDFQFGRIVRKRTFVKFLDNANFDGGNPWGQADSSVEISNDIYLVSQKTAENKLYVELELTSPLDLENFELNSRVILSRYCSWQYRGAGCQYKGPPIEPHIYNPSSYYDWGYDSDSSWTEDINYKIGSIVNLTNKKNSTESNTFAVYTCLKNHWSTRNTRPDFSPSFWRKDECSKTINSCKKRFPPSATITQSGLGHSISYYYNQSYINNTNYTTATAGLVYKSGSSIFYPQSFNSTNSTYNLNLNQTQIIRCWLQFPSGLISPSKKFSILHNVEPNCDFSGLNIYASGTTGLVTEFSVAHTQRNGNVDSDYFSGVRFAVPWNFTKMQPLHIEIMNGGATGINSSYEGIAPASLSSLVIHGISGAKYTYNMPSRKIINTFGTVIGDELYKRCYFRFKNPGYTGGIKNDIVFGLNSYQTPNITSNIKLASIGVWNPSNYVTDSSENSTIRVSYNTKINPITAIRSLPPNDLNTPPIFSDLTNIFEKDLVAWWDLNLPNASPYEIISSNLNPNIKPQVLKLTGSYDPLMSETTSIPYVFSWGKSTTNRGSLPFGGFPGTDGYGTASK